MSLLDNFINMDGFKDIMITKAVYELHRDKSEPVTPEDYYYYVTLTLLDSDGKEMYYETWENFKTPELALESLWEAIEEEQEKSYDYYYDNDRY